MLIIFILCDGVVTTASNKVRIIYSTPLQILVAICQRFVRVTTSDNGFGWGKIQRAFVGKPFHKKAHAIAAKVSLITKVVITTAMQRC